MKKETLTVDAALARGAAMPWALIRSYSKVSFGKLQGVPDTEELIEARYFDGTSEVRVFRNELGLTAAVLTLEDKDNERVITETREIENPLLGESFTVTNILDADEDGQCFIAETLLTGWKGAKE